MSGTDSTTKDDVVGATDDDTTTTPPADAKDWKAEAEKWKNLARKHEGQAKSNSDAAKRLAELEEADKTELQRATDKAADAEQRVVAAERNLTRIEVALDKAPDGMPLAQVRKLSKRLAGDSREELEADADELFADFASDTDDTDDDTDEEAPRRPRERLTPGAAPSAKPEKNDPASLAADVPRGW